MITETKEKRVEKIQVLLASLQKTFECPICLELMKNPISTRCGHKFCRHCIHEAIGRKAQAPCPLCKVSFSKRSLTSLPRWNEIVTSIRSLVVAYQLDTGFEFNTPHGPLCCSPLSSTPASQQSSSSSSQQRKRTAQGSSAAEKIAKKRKTQENGIFIDADAVSSTPEEPIRTNINISSSFPRKSSTAGKPKGPEQAKPSGKSGTPDNHFVAKHNSVTAHGQRNKPRKVQEKKLPCKSLEDPSEEGPSMNQSGLKRAPRRRGRSANRIAQTSVLIESEADDIKQNLASTSAFKEDIVSKSEDYEHKSEINVLAMARDDSNETVDKRKKMRRNKKPNSKNAKYEESIRMDASFADCETDTLKRTNQSPISVSKKSVDAGGTASVSGVNVNSLEGDKGVSSFHLHQDENIHTQVKRPDLDKENMPGISSVDTKNRTRTTRRKSAQAATLKSKNMNTPFVSDLEITLTDVGVLDKEAEKMCNMNSNTVTFSDEVHGKNEHGSHNDQQPQRGKLNHPVEPDEEAIAHEDIPHVSPCDGDISAVSNAAIDCFSLDGVEDPFEMEEDEESRFNSITSEKSLSEREEWLRKVVTRTYGKTKQVHAPRKERTQKDKFDVLVAEEDDHDIPIFSQDVKDGEKCIDEEAEENHHSDVVMRHIRDEQVGVMDEVETQESELGDEKATSSEGFMPSTAAGFEDVTTGETDGAAPQTSNVNDMEHENKDPAAKASGQPAQICKRKPRTRSKIQSKKKGSKLRGPPCWMNYQKFHNQKKLGPHVNKIFTTKNQGEGDSDMGKREFSNIEEDPFAFKTSQRTPARKNKSKRKRGCGKKMKSGLQFISEADESTLTATSKGKIPEEPAGKVDLEAHQGTDTSFAFKEVMDQPQKDQVEELISDKVQSLSEKAENHEEYPLRKLESSTKTYSSNKQRKRNTKQLKNGNETDCIQETQIDSDQTIGSSAIEDGKPVLYDDAADIEKYPPTRAYSSNNLKKRNNKAAHIEIVSSQESQISNKVQGSKKLRRKKIREDDCSVPSIQEQMQQLAEKISEAEDFDLMTMSQFTADEAKERVFQTSVDRHVVQDVCDSDVVVVCETEENAYDDSDEDDSHVLIHRDDETIISQDNVDNEAFELKDDQCKQLDVEKSVVSDTTVEPQPITDQTCKTKAKHIEDESCTKTVNPLSATQNKLANSTQMVTANTDLIVHENELPTVEKASVQERGGDVNNIEILEQTEAVSSEIKHTLKTYKSSEDWKHVKSMKKDFISKVKPKVVGTKVLRRSSRGKGKRQPDNDVTETSGKGHVYVMEDNMSSCDGDIDVDIDGESVKSLTKEQVENIEDVKHNCVSQQGEDAENKADSFKEDRDFEEEVKGCVSQQAEDGTDQEVSVLSQVPTDQKRSCPNVVEDVSLPKIKADTKERSQMQGQSAKVVIAEAECVSEPDVIPETTSQINDLLQMNVPPTDVEKCAAQKCNELESEYKTAVSASVCNELSIPLIPVSVPRKDEQKNLQNDTDCKEVGNIMAETDRCEDYFIDFQHDEGDICKMLDKTEGHFKSSTGSSTASMEQEGSSGQESKKNVENFEEPAQDGDGFKAVKDGTDSHDLLPSGGFLEHFISETDEDAKALVGKNGNSPGAANDYDKMETYVHAEHTENQDENYEYPASESGSISSVQEQNTESMNVLPDTEPESNTTKTPPARQKRNTKYAKTAGKPLTPSLSAKPCETDEETRISGKMLTDGPKTKRRSKRHLKGVKDVDPSSQTSEVQHNDEPGVSLLESLSSTAKKDTTPTQGRRGKRGLAKKGSPVLQPESSVCELVQDKNSSGNHKIPKAAQEDSEDDLPQRKSNSSVKRRRKSGGGDGGSNTSVSQEESEASIAAQQPDRQHVETNDDNDGNMSKGTPQSVPEGKTYRRSGRKQNVEVSQDKTSPLPDLGDHQQNVNGDQARKGPQASACREDTSTVHANIQGNTKEDQLDEYKLGKVTQESTQDNCVNNPGQSQGLFSENQLLSSKDINAHTGTPCQGSSGLHASSVDKNVSRSGKKLIFKRLQKSKDHMSKFYRNSLSPSSNVLPNTVSGNCVESERASLGCEVVPPTPSAVDNSMRSSESGGLFKNRKLKNLPEDGDDMKDGTGSSIGASPVPEKPDSQMQRMTEESEGQSLSILAPVTRDNENKNSPMKLIRSVSERESVNATPVHVEAPAHLSKDNSKKKRKLRSTPTSRNLLPEEQDTEELDKGCPRPDRTRTRSSPGDEDENRKLQRTENMPDTSSQTYYIEDTEFNNPGPETEAETNPDSPKDTLPTLETDQEKMDTVENVEERQEQHDQPGSSCSDEDIVPRKKSRRRCFMIQDDSSSDEETACTEMSESSRTLNMTSSSAISTQSSQSGKRRSLERDMKKLENEIAMLEAQLQEDTVVDGEVNTEALNGDDDDDDDDDVDIQDGSTGTGSDDDLFLSPPAPSPLHTQSSPDRNSPEQLQQGLSLPELDDIPIASSLDNATSILQQYTSTSVQKMALDTDIYSAEEDNSSQENAGRRSSNRRSVKAKRKLTVLHERKSVNNQNVTELEFSNSRDEGSAMVISSSGDRGRHQSVSTTKRKPGAPSERRVSQLDEPDIVVIPDSAENQKLRSPMSVSGGGNIQEQEKSPTHASRKFQFKKKMEPRRDGIHRKPEWCITASGLKPDQKKLLQKFTEKLGCQLTARFTPETTHVIFRPCDEVPLTCQRTLKYFQGIAGGAWILTFQWLEDSLRQNILLPEDNYEIRGDESCGPDHVGPKRSRTATKRLLEKYQILFYGSFVNLTRGDLDGIVRMCGGEVMEGPQQFSTKRNIKRVVVMESRSEDEEEQQLVIPRNLLRVQQKFPDLQIVSLHWLLDSVSQYEVIEPSVYSITD